MQNSQKNMDYPFSPLAGIGDIADRYDGFIFDIYGVIHNGLTPFPGTKTCLQNLQDAGKRVCLLSNTPKLRGAIRADLAAMGLTDDLYNGIVTAGDSARQKAEDFAGQNCWFCSKDMFLPIMEGLDCTLLDTPEGADFILNAISGHFPQDQDRVRAQLEKAKDLDLPMICANPDLVVMIGETQNICAGTYALMYEDMGGVVSYHGKPHAPVYQDAQNILGLDDKSKIVAVGDSLHTDMQGANKFGIDAIFNVDGIHYEEIADATSESGICYDKLAALIEKQNHKPDYVLNGFAW